MLTLNFICIISLIIYHIYHRGHNFPAPHLYSELNNSRIQKSFDSLKKTFTTEGTAKLAIVDWEELQKLRGFLLIFEFNLPVRSFHQARKLRLEIESLLKEFKNKEVWPLRKDNLILNRLIVGKVKLKDVSPTRFQCEKFSQSYLVNLNKKNRRIQKSYFKLLDLLNKKWVFSL